MSGIEGIVDQMEDWAEYTVKKYEQIIAERESDVSWLKCQNDFLTGQNRDLMNKLSKQREIIYTKQAEINELIRNIR